MEIRKAKISDLDELLRLEKLYINEDKNKNPVQFRITGFNDEIIKKTFRKKIKDKNYFFQVLTKNNKLYGYLTGEITIEKMEKYGYLHKKIPYGYLENVFLTKTQRGKGYFSLLKDNFFQFLKEHNIKYCKLHVETHNSAEEIYLKLGFKAENKRMIKKL